MFLRASIRRHPAFKEGMRDIAQVAPGIASWGLMTGVATLNSGLGWVESLAMMLLVFAGSSQLAALPLIVAGAPLWVIWATAFCVNLRFVVFSAHLRPYFIHQPLFQRLVNGYLTPDMSYALFTQRFPNPSDDPAERDQQQAYLAGSCFVNWGSWVSSGLCGLALSQAIPARWGLGFAGILALVGILCSLVSSRLHLLSAMIAASAAVMAFALPIKLNILVAILVAVLACLTISKTQAWSQSKTQG